MSRPTEVEEHALDAYAPGRLVQSQARVRAAAAAFYKGGFCERCFEDVYPTVWLGPFQLR